MYRCRFCGFEAESIEEFDIDFQGGKGYWCPDCDGFTYYGEENRSYVLILEDKEKTDEHKKVPFKVHCSPLRYPGGKSLMVGSVLGLCRSEQMSNFVEPFAGGASIGLSLLLAGKVKDLYLNDKEFGVYSLYRTIKEKPETLLDRINAFSPSEETYKIYQRVVLDGYPGCTTEEAAWALLVVNRLAFSGIPFANCMKDPAARWNAKTLCRRIEEIHRYADRIHVSNEDALEYIQEMYWLPNTTIVIDPPYWDKASALYVNSYNTEDHKNLSFLLDELHKGFPGADIIVTYDYQKEIEEMYDWPKQMVIGRKYSIISS